MNRGAELRDLQRDDMEDEETAVYVTVIALLGFWKVGERETVRREVRGKKQCMAASWYSGTS